MTKKRINDNYAQIYLKIFDIRLESFLLILIRTEKVCGFFRVKNNLGTIN